MLILRKRPWDQPEFSRSYERLLECNSLTAGCTHEIRNMQAEDCQCASGEVSEEVYSLPAGPETTQCLPPNPSPPPFQLYSKPVQLKQSSHHYTMQEGSPLKAENLPDPFYATVIHLQREIMEPGGVELHISASSLRNNVAFVELGNRVWIAGWNSKVTSLHGQFHIGDQVVAFNDFPIYKLDPLKKGIKSLCCKEAVVELSQDADGENVVAPVKGRITTCRLRIRRLPLAKALIVCRQNVGQDVGVAFSNGTNQIEQIDPFGALACTGLSSSAQRFNESESTAKKSSFLFKQLKHKSNDRSPLVPWTVTEINNRTLDLFYAHDEASRLVSALGMEVSLVLQPSNFIDDLRKAMKRHYLYKKFLL